MFQKVNCINSSNKILGVELLRFIAAFAVLVYHYKHFFLSQAKY